MTAPLPNHYDRIVADFQRVRGFRERPYLERFVSLLPPAAHVLDLGCGTGVPMARYLLKQGCRVTGVDASAGMLAEAHRQLPQADFHLADLNGFVAPQRYAGVLLWDALFHLPKTEHAAVFRQIFDCLDAGGWLLLSAGGSAGEDFVAEMFGQPFFYSGHAPDTTVAQLEQAGFVVPFWEIDDPSSRGHAVFFAQKPA